MSQQPEMPHQLSRRQILFALAGSALAGCGGGGGSGLAGLSTGGTGSFTVGPITGLGSIIVNGIRYDDSQATVIGDAGSREALKLGMVVSVQGSPTRASNAPGAALVAEAMTIRCASEWKGPVSAVDAAAGSFLLLGQPVDVLASTVFEGAVDLAALAAWPFAEIHGYLDAASGRLQATRVDARQALDEYRLSGVVAQKDAAGFTIGSLRIAFSAATPQPPSWGVGSLVRVGMTPAQAAIEVTSAAQQARAGLDLEDGYEVEIEGTVTAYPSGGRTFAVNGVEVDGSRLASLAGLAVGVRVEVKGALTGSGVIASAIKLKGRAKDLKEQPLEYEFHGQVSQLGAGSFVVRGYRIRYSPAALHDGLLLREGLPVEVKARRVGSELVADEIELDD